jgi:hypothetical protein
VSEVCVVTQDKQNVGHPLYETAFRRGDCIQVFPDGAFWGTKVETHPTWVIFKTPSEPLSSYAGMLDPVVVEVPEPGAPVPGSRRVITKLREFYFNLDSLTFMNRRGATPFITLTAFEANQLLASKTLRP